MNSLWIKYGGSCRKLKRDTILLNNKFGDDFRPVGSTMSGHWSNQNGVIPDTPDNKQWIKEQKGISISRTMNNIQKRIG